MELACESYLSLRPASVQPRAGRRQSVLVQRCLKHGKGKYEHLIWSGVKGFQVGQGFGPPPADA